MCDYFLFSDHKKRGKSPGGVNLNLLEITIDPEHQAVKTYVEFATKYTSLLLGVRKIVNHMKETIDGHIFQILTPSDEAFAVVVFENNQEKWDDIHARDEENEARSARGLPPFTETEENDRPKKKAKWTSMEKGHKNSLFHDNWHKDGKQRFNELQKLFFNIRVANDRRVAEAHAVAWKQYNKDNKVYPIASEREVSTNGNDDDITHTLSYNMEDAPVVTLNDNGAFDVNQIYMV